MTQPVTLTSAMRANLLSLQQTGNQLSTTQLDLSTGNKVNSALDNPVEYFAAQALNSRASGLSALLDGMGQAVSTLQATSQAISSITGLVNQLTSIANQANQDLQTQTTQNILAGTVSGNGMSSGTVAALGSSGTLVLTPTNGTQATFTVVTAETLNTLVSQINATQGFSASIVMGNGTNTLPDGQPMTAGLAYLEVTSTNGDGTISTAGSTAGVLTTLGLGASSSVYTVGGAANDQINFASVITQINQMVTNDANYQGNNLISGAAGNNLTVNFSQVGSAITINKVDLTTASTGLNLTTQNITTAGGVAAAITAINTALTTLATASASFANGLSVIQTRQDFTTNLINTLQSGATQLTIADKNEEGASMLALQTQQQLGIEALSLSSQANQSVLRLFA